MRLDDGYDHVGDALSERHQGYADARADDDADDGAEDRQDHRFRADHGPDLAPLHADRAQQADLVGALEHRQHQRVDDPDEGDDHRQGEQGVDQAEQLVDLATWDCSNWARVWTCTFGYGASSLSHFPLDRRRCQSVSSRTAPGSGSVVVGQEEAG